MSLTDFFSYEQNNLQKIITTRMVRKMNIEVDSHTHTVASGHAYSTLAENVGAAAARNIKLLAITDHGPAMPDSPHHWFFKNMRIIPRVIDGVGILRGVEANIVDYNGEIDIEAHLLDHMDIVLASLHEPVISPATKSKNTDGVVKAIASDKVNVFAHGGNPAFPIDFDEVAKAAAYYKVLIEINNSSFTTSRPGSEMNCRKLAEAVVSHGGYLTFGSDAHIASRVGAFDECLTLVKNAGVPKKNIINYSGSKFLKYIQKEDKKNDFTVFEKLFDKHESQ